MNGPSISKKEINEQINELLHHSIHSDGVVNLFQDFENGFSLFDPNFIEKISKMDQKNLSIALLSKVLMDELRSITRTNLVKGEEFSERLRRIMKRYKEGLVHNAETLDQFTGLAEILKEDETEYETGHLSVIRKQLIELAKETLESEKDHEKLGLTRAEMAFYNAVANSDKIQDFYTDEQLIKLTKELTETISKEMTKDWAVRESGRANVRRTIKRLLKKYKYPGNFKETIQLVVKQAEHWDVIRENEGLRGA